MEGFNKDDNILPEWKKKLFVGVEIPLPWLIGIVAALLFNAGIVYTQFNALRDTTKDNADVLKTIVQRQVDDGRKMDRIEIQNAAQEAAIADHERRIRDVERKK